MPSAVSLPAFLLVLELLYTNTMKPNLNCLSSGKLELVSDLSSDLSQNVVHTIRLCAPHLMDTAVQSLTKMYFIREPSTLANDMKTPLFWVNDSMDASNYLADCFFEVEGKTVAAHKVIVCSRCEYFRYRVCNFLTFCKSAFDGWIEREQTGQNNN